MQTIINPSPTSSRIILMEGRKAFTLIELIIVITILAILATISFISYQDYTKSARDTNRVSTIKNIESGLELSNVKTGDFPSPESAVTITAGGIPISYQGKFGDEASKVIAMNKTPTDPLDNEKYTYLVNANKDKYQLLAFMEGKEYKQTSYLGQVYTSDYTSRYPKVSGNNLGILVDATTNQPITTTVDVITYSGADLKAILSNKANGTITGTGTKLVALKNTTNTGDYDPSLIAYYDMETFNKINSTTNLSGSILSDLSGNGYEGKLFGTTINTGINSGLIIGDTDYILVDNFPAYHKNDFTIIMSYKLTKFVTSGTWKHNVFFSNYTDTNNRFYGFCSSPSNGTDFSILRNNTIYSVIGGTSISGVKDNNICTLNNKINLVYRTSKGHFTSFVNSINSTNYTTYSGSWINGDNFNLPTIDLDKFYIGYIPSGDAHLNGELYNFRIYNRALNDSEIKALYDATK